MIVGSSLLQEVLCSFKLIFIWNGNQLFSRGDNSLEFSFSFHGHSFALVCVYVRDDDDFMNVKTVFYVAKKIFCCQGATWSIKKHTK
jgi:hypothetical protein